VWVVYPGENWTEKGGTKAEKRGVNRTEKETVTLRYPSGALHFITTPGPAQQTNLFF